MKKETLLILSLFNLIPTLFLFAQPANDKVCDALEILLDSAAISTSNIGATIELEEESITPPGSIHCDYFTWCDGNDGIPLINHSLWYKFIAPTTTAVNIDLCGSTFNTQLALYEVGDCGDWSSFDLILATDNQSECGIDEGLASSLYIECLNPGQEYYVLVDDWRDNSNASVVDSGHVEIFIETKQSWGIGILTCNPTMDGPICPGGSEGFIEPLIVTATYPLTVQWSTGDSTLNLYNIPAGTYTVSVTDFCGATLVSSFDLEDPSPPSAIELSNLPNEVVQPGSCGNGSRGGQILTWVTVGQNPSYQWSTGDSTAFISDVPYGSHTVTITDYCGLNQFEKTYHIGASAGEDIQLNSDCQAQPIGLDHSSAGGEIEEISYNTDQSLSQSIACVDVSGYSRRYALWRAFDPANDFSLTGEMSIHGIEVFVKAQQYYWSPEKYTPIKLTAYTANTTDLDDPDLQLTTLNSIETIIPSLAEYTPFIIPLESSSLSSTDKIAIKLETLTPAVDRHRIDFAANKTSTTQTTYMTSVDCNIPTPVKVADIGYDSELVMNLFLSKGKGLSYQWDGPVDDPTSPTPMALGTETTTYTVTITDQACGTTYTDDVTVSCWTVNTKNIAEQSFSISPNPSSGEFFASNKGESGVTKIQVYDLQGKLVYTKKINIGNEDPATLNLNGFAKGIYFAKIEQDDTIETHKLIIQ